MDNPATMQNTFTFNGVSSDDPNATLDVAFKEASMSTRVSCRARSTD